MQNKLKTNKRTIEESDEEMTRLRQKTRNMQRELDELNEQVEILNREIGTLRKTK
jgi:peptidoglycan hydrolase CwlO-like protein